MSEVNIDQETLENLKAEKNVSINMTMDELITFHIFQHRVEDMETKTKKELQKMRGNYEHLCDLIMACMSEESGSVVIDSEEDAREALTLAEEWY